MWDKEPNSSIPTEVPSMDIHFNAFQEVNKASAYNKQNSEINHPGWRRKSGAFVTSTQGESTKPSCQHIIFHETPIKPKETLQKTAIGGDKDKLQEQVNNANKAQESAREVNDE